MNGTATPLVGAAVRTAPLRIGVVGLGFGQHIIQLLGQKPASRDFALAAVCDMRVDVAMETGARLGVPAYASLDALLADPGIDVVGLFTQPAGRAQLLRRIVRAGKDVLTTKPFELDPAEARAVLEEARALGRVVHLNSPAPLPTADLALVERWRAGHDLGRPVAGRAGVWASYQETADGTWHDDPERCPAAPLFRLGIYMIHDLGRVLGPAESVQLQASALRTGRPTPDNAQLNIAYRNGALGHVFASFCVDDGDAYQNSLVLQFERGTIYRNVGGARPAPFDPQAADMVLVGRRKGARAVLEQARVDEMAGAYLWSALAAQIRERRPIDDEYIDRIVDGVAIIDALRRAQKTGSAKI